MITNGLKAIYWVNKEIKFKNMIRKIQKHFINIVFYFHEFMDVIGTGIFEKE